jgi:glucose-1-phosphate thymidylyltransferase
MKIIVPMAGMGKRMRPHTLTTPKPLLPIAGKPIVQLLCEELAKVCTEKIEEIAFIIGDFGKEAEENLVKVAESLGAKGSIYHQHEALGTAHAVLCAKESLSGKVIVAFADTLFKADFEMDEAKDAVIWVQKIDDPSAFGVVKIAEDGTISDFIEKPKDFVSDLAIIGIYYFKDGENLKNELQYLLDNEIKDKGEYQITNGLENMKNKGLKIYPGEVIEWLDCGNKDATVHTNTRWLELHKDNYSEPSSLKLVNSEIIQPCFIGENVEIHNSKIGPHVSIGNNTKISNSEISTSIIQTNAVLQNTKLSNSMLGNFVQVNGGELELSLGDYSVISPK